MTKERLEHLRLMADQCENLDPTDTRELLAEIERLQDIEAAAKECPYKWRMKCCGAWTNSEKDICFSCFGCGEDFAITEKVLP